MAAEEGVDIVDLAIASMSSLTSQPSLNAVVAALVDEVNQLKARVAELER